MQEKNHFRSPEKAFLHHYGREGPSELSDEQKEELKPILKERDDWTHLEWDTPVPIRKTTESHMIHR